MKKVVVGLSGGVDSSVAAYLLQQEGYEVIGLFMINWRETTGKIESNCHWQDDLMFAEMVSKKLQIPLHTVDFTRAYKQRVVDYMFDEYQKGRTPNPDVLCNREIKFDLFTKTALDLGGNYVATGHYCRKETIEKSGKIYYRLLAGIDTGKDQSYFLCQLNQEQLKHVLFPLGHLLKSQVRKIAEEQNLATSTRKDSQGVCFIGKIDLPAFLQQKLSSKKGYVVEISPNHVMYQNYSTQDWEQLIQPFFYSRTDGKIIGEHAGAHFYTVGQRKGLHIGGKKEPLFVIATDTRENIVYVGEGDNHPGLFRKGLLVQPDSIHWIRPDYKMEQDEEREYKVRIRYRQPLQKAKLIHTGKGINILFSKSQRGITAGQFAAWYMNEELIGSGVIH